MKEIRFFVDGEAKPAGSKVGYAIPDKKRPGKQRVIITDQTKQAGKNWRSDVRAAAKTKLSKNHTPLEGPLYLVVHFYFSRPKSHYRTGKNAHLLKDSAPEYHVGRPDMTKLLRAIEDALNNFVWKDDSQIVRQWAFKDYDQIPGALVRIGRFPYEKKIAHINSLIAKYDKQEGE